MKKLPLHWKIIIGLIAGIVWALAASSLGFNDFTKDWINPFGVIFIRMLKFIAVPLVLFSIIAGMSELKDITKLGRLGAKTLGMYLITTVASIGIGLILVNTIKPGEFVDDQTRVKNRIAYETWAVQEGVEIKDDKNFREDPAYSHVKGSLGSMEGADTGVATSRMASAKKSQDGGPLQFIVDMVPENIILSVSNNGLMLQVIFFAIFFGISMALLPEEKVSSLKSFVHGTNEVFLRMVDIIMKGAPFFVFALMAGVLSKMADSPAEVIEIFKGLGSYSIVVAVGLFAMIFIVYPLLTKLVVSKVSYREFFKRISPAQLMAFSTSSSAATLPVTMECVEENMGVSRNITSFVLPIGATVNMDGTSLYQAVAVIFLAQLHMVDLTLGQQLTIVLTATLASIGSAAVPSAGLVMLIIVLQSVGLNPLWIAIIFPVDRILDMCRTVVNVTGDATVSTIIAKSEGELNYQ